MKELIDELVEITADMEGQLFDICQHAIPENDTAGIALNVDEIDGLHGRLQVIVDRLLEMDLYGEFAEVQ
jgi:hypothetical protein